MALSCGYASVCVSEDTPEKISEHLLHGGPPARTSAPVPPNRSTMRRRADRAPTRRTVGYDTVGHMDVWVKAKGGLLRADSIVKIEATDDAVLAWQAGTPADEPEMVARKHDHQPPIPSTMAAALAETIAFSRKDDQVGLTVIVAVVGQQPREWRWTTN